MKKYLALLILLCASSAFAQNPTAVTGTITDPNGIAYYPATVTATLTPSATNPTVGGQPINPNPGTPYVAGPVSTSSNGSFSIPLFANGDITPAATQYVITVSAAGTAPPAGLGPQTFSVTVTISGSSQSLTTTLNAAALALLPTSTGTSVAFSAVTTGTNAVALHVGTGGTLDATGSGTITATTATGNAGTATALAATPTLCSGGTPLASGVLANGNATGCQAASGGNLTAKYIIGDTTVGTLTNAKAWPSLYNGPDSPPLTRNAMDEECDGTALNNPNSIWTWNNANGSTTTGTQGSTVWTQLLGYCNVTAPTNGSANVARFAGQTLPSAPWTFVTKLVTNHNGTNATGGIVISEAATGKYLMFGYQALNSGSNTTEILVGSTAANRYTSNFIQWPFILPGYFMINRTSTTLTFSYSTDGISYTSVYSAAITADFTTAPDTVGIGVNPYSSTANVDFEYFRRCPGNAANAACQ